MANRIISRTTGVPANTRAGVKFGQVFSYLDKRGNVREEQFLQIGSSDKHYSIKASNGNLSSSPVAKGSKPIAVVGSFKVTTTFFKDIAKDSRKDFRAQLRIGDVYRAVRNGSAYMHLGELDDGRYFGLNLDTRDFATTGKSDKEVMVVGYGQFDVKTV